MLTIAPALTDIDGGPACGLAVVVAPAHGSARVEGHTVVYQPAADWHGEDALLIAAGIGGRWSAPATQAITVRAVDDPPVASATAAVTDEDTAVVVPVVVGDADGGAPSTLAVASQPAHGLCRIEGLSVVYTPAADWSGSDSFAVMALSGALISAPATVAVVVRAVDDPPRIDPLADLTATAGATVRVVCRIGDVDDDLASLVMDAQLELGGARAASAVAVRWEGLGAQRTLVADLPAGLTGSALATVGVTDPAGRRSAISFRLTVLPPEPVAQPVLQPASSPAASVGGGGGAGGCGLGGLGIAILGVGAAMAGRRRRR